MKLKEKFIRKKHFTQGVVVGFRTDEVLLPNNKIATREYLDHPGAVGIIPITKTGKIVMVKQYRHPVKEITWEIPAGKIDKDQTESILECAQRELREETGYRAKSFKKILSFWPTAAFANEVIHIFLAKDLIAGEKNLDHDEFVNTFEISRSEALKAIKNGKIRDSKTIIAILSYLTYFGG